LVDSASVQLSLNVNSPVVGEVIASEGADNDELEGLSLISFDVRAKKDNVLLTDLVASVTKTGTGSAVASTAVLYSGSTVLGSSSVVGEID